MLSSYSVWKGNCNFYNKINDVFRELSVIVKGDKSIFSLCSSDCHDSHVQCHVWALTVADCFGTNWKVRCTQGNWHNSRFIVREAGVFFVRFLLPGISRQQTIFLSDLRFLVQWFDGSINLWLRRCAVCLSKCLAAAPVFLLEATRHFVLFSCKICPEVNGKSSSRSIVRSVFFFRFICFILGFKISYSEYFFVTQIVI